MDRQVRRLGLVLTLLFAALFLQLNNIQVLQAKNLDQNPHNVRTTTRAFTQPRGSIATSSGVVVARSVPVKGSSQLLRVYPEGTLFAPVTGYFSHIYGMSGAESAYNSYLSAAPASSHNLAGLFGSASDANNVILTLSNTLQKTAETALGAHKGAVVALNPSTGAILALWSYPTYNPNALASPSATVEMNAWKAGIARPAQPMLDRAISNRYPPGSTFKIVTSSTVYDQDPALAKKSFPVLTALTLPGTSHKLANYAHEACGGGIASLFAVSCDSGFGQIGLDLGARRMASEAQRFGFNQRPPLDISGAVPSYFPPVSSFANDTPALAFSAIGQQNVAASPLEMALVGAAIANHGVIMKPHVMYQIRNGQGRLVTAYRPSIWKRATSSSTASKVTQLMIGVVNNPAGTAHNMLSLPGVQVAAKTGTAQTVPGANLNDAWMVAFAPASHPKIVVAAFVAAEPGAAAQTGDMYAGPVVRAVLSAALNVKGG